MARMKLGINKRSCMIGVKVTPVFRMQLENAAIEKGLTLSSFIYSVLQQYLDI